MVVDPYKARKRYTVTESLFICVGVYIVMVGTKYRPYLSWTDCNLKVEVDPG